MKAQMVQDQHDARAAEAGAQATAILCRLLKDPQGEVRIAAAEAIGEGGPEPPPAELIAAADDKDREVRLAVAKSLLRRNGPEDGTAARLLCSLIADPAPIADRFQILRMVQGTSKETQDRAIQALAGLLSHVDAAVLPDVIACLGESGQCARVALPVLEKLLDDPEPSTRASATMAILTINEKPTPRVLAVLVEMLADKNMPQDWRMDAFGRIKEANPDALARATPALIRQLGDKSPDVRRAAIELLMADRRGPACRAAEGGREKVKVGTLLRDRSRVDVARLGFEISGAGVYDSGCSRLFRSLVQRRHSPWPTNLQA